jgi:uncharacterized protein (DUF1684 family)
VVQFAFKVDFNSAYQAMCQLYTSWTCYKTTGTIPAAIERGLFLAWTARWIKKC